MTAQFNEKVALPLTATNTGVKTANLWEFTRVYALPLWKWYSVGFVALAATNIITLKIPQLAKQVVNTLAVSGEVANSGLYNVTLAIVGLGVLQIFIRSLSRILVFWPGRSIESAAKNDLFAKVLTVPQWLLLKFGMGDLISRLSNDIGQLRAFYAFGLLQILNLIFLVVFTVSQMLSAHVMLTVYCLLPILLMVVVARVAMPQMQKYSRLNQEALGRLTNRVTEAFVHVHVVQANGAEETFVARSDQENENVYLTNIKLIFVRNVIFPLMSCLVGLSQVVVVIFGGIEVVNGRLTIGDILAFNIYIGLLSFPLTALGMILSLQQRAATAVRRIHEIQAAQSENQGPLNVEREKDHANSATRDIDADILLEIRNLTYSYPNHESDAGVKNLAAEILTDQRGPVLKDISFAIRRGERMGIFGAIGSGKSTLFNLILRLFDPPRGTIFWKGRDILDLDPIQLRKEIGYASQTVHLFSDTIRANLLLGTELNSVSDENLKEATDAAQISEEINRFDLKMATEIGENGIRLSGGQKQRLALARLFLRPSELLILDDVISAVDHETEEKLISYFHRMSKSLFFASHRTSALKECHQVLVLDKGCIRARGAFSDIAHYVNVSDALPIPSTHPRSPL